MPTNYFAIDFVAVETELHNIILLYFSICYKDKTIN